MRLTMDDCIMYNKYMNRCNGLKELYCQNEDCSFYKPRYEQKEKPVKKRSDGIWKAQY